MQETTYRIDLLKEYLKGTIHPDNHLELKSLFEEYPDLFDLIHNLEDPSSLQQALQEYRHFHTTKSIANKEQTLQNILHRIEAQPKKRIRANAYRSLLRYAAAASILVFLSVGIWYLLSLPNSSSDLQTLKEAEKLNPGSNRATLLAADGSVIELNESHSGIVIGDEITYNDGSLLLKDIPEETALLTLSTPKGGQYHVTLPDGSKVWLNADSRLKYPNRFTAPLREVELDGEAYFEVTSNAKQPFVVKTPNEQVEVLGTHFNINSYRNEEASKVALLEGKVRVVADNKQSSTLRPGQQTFFSNNQMKTQNINVEESIAWKNGEFAFNNESLGTAMRQVARWYDIEIEVAPSLKELALWGSVSRLDNFDKVLKIIKMTDDNIKIKIEGRRVKIMK
ncbi:FecR family protein [Sphingobacterium yanglingense]|uniref:FecR family protein n=1 Tax=Sphingobacterium yanglingense TaxID=1437280 RepID=A0A4V3DCV9_9SPHI|nr:FecR domain-containing protein [Sphingobacterium yanglingense]TDQ73533.1 FecR family protein [Sphingobacterium yanglingense]